MILDHALWPALRPCVVVDEPLELGHHPSARLEVDARGVPGYLIRQFLAMEVPCANHARCGRLVHPVRQRSGPYVSLYLSVTCSKDDNPNAYVCRNGAAAREVVEAICADLRGFTDPRQPRLFEETE